MSEQLDSQVILNVKKKAFLNVETKVVFLKVSCTLTWGKFVFTAEDELNYNLISQDIGNQRDYLYDFERGLREQVMKQYQQLKQNLKVIEELGYGITGL